MPYLFLFLSILPSFAWLFFFLKEDINPEPKKMILCVFIGGIFAAIIAVIIQILFKNFFLSPLINNEQITSFLCFSFIEEIIKFLVAYFLIRKSRFFDEPIDAMIYMIVVALGFALLENMAIILDISLFSEALTVITFRFVGATLLHALSSALVGYYWAKGLISKNKKVFWPYILKGLILATLLHTAFNYFIIISKDAAIYPMILLTVAALFIFWDFEKIKGFVSR